jgi:hypothetical protein
MKDINQTGLKDMKNIFQKNEKLLFLIEVGIIELELKLQCDFVQKKNIIGLWKM